MGSPGFPRLRGADSQQSRVQDSISNQLQPIAESLARTPIMGAPPPPWILPALLAGMTNFGGGFAPSGFHRDALGYVHGRGKITSAAGVAAFTPVMTLPIGYRPSDIMTFAVEGTGAYQSLRITPAGVVSVLLLIAAGGTVDLDFYFLAEG